MKPSGIEHFMLKGFMKATYVIFYLVLRDYFSQILFFEN